MAKTVPARRVIATVHGRADVWRDENGRVCQAKYPWERPMVFSNKAESRNMTEYERTGEKTYDPAALVGWGAWYDRDGRLRRVCGGGPDVGLGTERRGRRYWAQPVYAFGFPPFYRAREVVAPKSGADLRRWMAEHPEVEVRSMDSGNLSRWRPSVGCFERFAKDNGWIMKEGQGFTTPHVPADGKGWDR